MYGSPSGSDFERGGVCFAFGFVWRCGSGGDIAFEVHLSSRFYRRVCLWFTPALAVLSPRLPLVHACPRGSIAAFAFGSRLSFFLCQEKRDGLRCLAFLFRGSRSPSCVFAVSVRLSAFVSSLRVCAFLYGNLYGLPGCGGRGYGVGGAAFVRFCASTLALLCFPPGVRWGCAPQTCAKESSTLWTLFTLRRGYVSADSRPYRKRQRPNHRTHACKTQAHGKT